MIGRDKTYLLKELTRTINESDSTAAFCLCPRWILKDALAALKEQEEKIADYCYRLQDAEEKALSYNMTAVNLAKALKGALEYEPQKAWNALWAEEDYLEKKYVGTNEHNSWFMIYRPWLQRGFEIAMEATWGKKE